MHSRKSCDFEGHALIWQSEESTSKQKAAEYSERRIGFFEAQLRAARQRRAERLQKREEARQARRARLQAEALHTNHRPCSVMVREEAPVYMQRQFIHSGYLIGGTPAEAAWRTVTSLNNETLNAWTMVPPFVLAWWGVFMARKHLPTECAAFWLLLLSCVPHAPFSIGLHLTCGSSRAWRDLWRGLDVFFIFTCGVPRAAALSWYVFYGWQQYALFMAVAISIYLHSIHRNILCGRVKEISKPALAQAVTTTIACYASPLVLAATAELINDGWGQICNLSVAIFATFAVSMLTYGCKYPERLAPGKFDLIGNGHQLMHISATIEYGLELMFLWHMASQKSAAKESIAADDQAIRFLLGN